jgi:hypothetical protein
MHGLLGHRHRHERSAGGGGGEHHSHNCQRTAAHGVTHSSRWHLDGTTIYTDPVGIQTGR